MRRYSTSPAQDRRSSPRRRSTRSAHSSTRAARSSPARSATAAAFTKGMKELYKKLFPDYELKPCPPEHGLYNVHFPVNPSAGKVPGGVQRRAAAGDSHRERTFLWRGRPAARRREGRLQRGLQHVHVRDGQGLEGGAAPSRHEPLAGGCQHGQDGQVDQDRPPEVRGQLTTPSRWPSSGSPC